jgi:hypothetical protein
MLAIELRKFLDKIPDDANILIYVTITNDIRQLIFSDIDKNHDGNFVIDAEYDVPTKQTIVAENKILKAHMDRIQQRCKLSIIIDALEFIAKQDDKVGNWAVEIARNALAQWREE